jgi:purine nucleosidase
MSEPFRPPAGPRYRVISDNDYAGDPDGLFQLAHHVLSPSVEMRAVIGSHLAVDDPFDPSGRSAANGAAAATRVLELLGLTDAVPVIAGSELPLTSRTDPQRSPAAEAIVAEAMRTDTDLPLLVVLGAGLTELASAYLLEPAIADRLTAVWIGGPEYLELGAVPPPNALPVEYNLNIDLLAGQVIFDSAIPLWQVPRNAYRECIASMSELILRVRSRGSIGAHLYQTLVDIHELVAPHGLNMGEVYVLGDSPLVLLTALQTGFEADPASSSYIELARPHIGSDGGYQSNPAGHPVRVYGGLDVRLMLDDLYAKLELVNAGPR